MEIAPPELETQLFLKVELTIIARTGVIRVDLRDRTEPSSAYRPSNRPPKTSISSHSSQRSHFLGDSWVGAPPFTVVLFILIEEPVRRRANPENCW